MLHWDWLTTCRRYLICRREAEQRALQFGSRFDFSTSTTISRLSLTTPLILQLQSWYEISVTSDPRFAFDVGIPPRGVPNYRDAWRRYPSWMLAGYSQESLSVWFVMAPLCDVTVMASQFWRWMSTNFALQTYWLLTMCAVNTLILSHHAICSFTNWASHARQTLWSRGHNQILWKPSMFFATPIC